MSQAIPEKYRDLFTKRAFASLARCPHCGDLMIAPVAGFARTSTPVAQPTAALASSAAKHSKKKAKKAKKTTKKSTTKGKAKSKKKATTGR